MSNNCLLTKTAPAALFGLAALIVLPFFGCKKNIADAPEPEPQSVEQAALTAFKITKPVQAAGVITNQAVTVQVPAGTDVTALTAAATLPDGAAIDPDPKKARDYSTSVTFTVTAADGANRAAYIVTVTTAQAAAPAPAPEEDAAITSFTINNTAGQIDQNTRAINLIFSYDTDVNALAPVIEYTGASVSPESGAARDFSAPVTYTVTAKDGGQKAYAVTVTKMEEGKYSVIYEPGGAAGSMPPSVFTFDVAARLQKNIYTKTGYTFTGWKDGAGNSFIDEREGSNFAPQGESLTLTAQWRPNTYTVVFAGNGGGGTMTDQPFEYDEAATALTPVGFTRAGYAFVNWKNGDNTYTNAQPVSNLTAEDRAKVTLTAQWVAQYTVAYNLNGGTGTTSAAETRAVGEGKALAGGFCTKIGYTFGGWNTNAAGTGTNYAAGSSQTDLSTTAGGTVTLYAKWTANTYTVSYIANAPSGKTAAGTAPAPTTHTYDAAGNLAANPFSVPDYAFAGWNTSDKGTGTTYASGASVTNLTAVASAAVPLYAKWEPQGYVRIPAGTFTMGSPESEPERKNNEVQHQVTLSRSFWMGKCQVTQADYQAVMGNNPSNVKGDTLPVEQVSWYDAVTYCNKRSEREGLAPAYTINGTDVTWNRNANGYRLPTEAEWEYACRAGTTTPFNTGNDITTDQANYYGTSFRRTTTTVGSFAPNSWGLYDMHGNVFEWCWDRYGDYGAGSQTDPVGASSDSSLRVSRGGAWDSSRRLLRSAYRSNDTSSSGASFLGFRLARSE